ncbi:secretin N-terminal domain-containing protein [Ectopseudomonas mendocina]|uniref:Type II and III secretion system protein n=1 Tax=Ectopseudomonas mendocina S5.2 TaxID=1225174 RepID=A0ABM5VV76_ECTME|nr:secretin N-terminal domain-containing protein [Pseudomonas mendocina]ALN18770.1 type II and III secretion system protein [Pseudomonas mendocina S5.2]KES00376.1 PulD [Pseudomonas mendocina]
MFLRAFRKVAFFLFCAWVYCLPLQVIYLVLVTSCSAHAAERIELYDATLQDFVEWSSQMLNKSVVVGSDIRSAPISIFANYRDNDELEALIANAVTSSGFHFAARGNTLLISAQPIPEPLDLKTKVFQLQHLQSDFAYQSILDVLRSQQGENQQSGPSLMATPSPTSNAVIVTATESQLETVASVLAEIDKPRRQVVITAVVAELADNDFEALGLNVGAKNDRTDLGGISLRGADKSDLGFSLTFNGPTLSAFLQAVKVTGNNRILSTPQLLTLNREAASIVVGQNVPFITGQTTSGSTPASDPFQTIVRQDVGVSLDVTPFITPSGAIELSVNQSASTVSDDRSAADIITNTRRITTKVQLPDGGGVLLGGLRSEQRDESVSRVPFLADIPLIGPVFRSTSVRTRGTNLVVLLTAAIHTEERGVAVPDAVSPLVPQAVEQARGHFGAAGGTARLADR